MSRKSFGLLLQKYLKGECSPEEKEFVEHWYGLLDTNASQSDEALDWTALEDKLWNQMQLTMEAGQLATNTRNVPLSVARYRWIGMAAAVLLLVGLFWLQHRVSANLTTGQPIGSIGENWIEQTNTSSKALAILLEDGSKVQLAAYSSLRFPRKFAAESRTVYLNGDAFFSIQHNPSRPFYVHTGNVITKVLGTSFFIRTQAATKQVRVEVVTGRVAVYEVTTPKQKNTNGVVLTPNQAATFYGEEQHFVTGLVERPVVIQKPDVDHKPISFQFDDTPLADVIERLEEAYGIAIEVENDQQNNCPLTADLSNQPLYTQLDIICAALKSSYKVQGTTILISGKGCDAN